MGHRDTKRQASGAGSLAGNTAPGIRVSPTVAPSSVGGLGTQCSSPVVYGCMGSLNSSRTEASSTVSPAYITTTRSATAAITPRSCVTYRIPALMRCFRSTINSRIVACVVTSSPVVGSSRISRSGSQASAMAITTRCCWPPLNSWGYRRRTASGSASRTLSNSSMVARRLCRASAFRCSRSTSETCGPTRMVGFSDVAGS